jgi:ribosome maturation factor RimP
MQQIVLRVRRLAEPVLATMGYELVGVEHVVQGGRPTLRIYIDKPAGITVDDCQRVSEQVSALLDVEEAVHGSYCLEVSSPGLERPLFEAKHFVQFTGERAKIRMKSLINGRRKFDGVIQGLQDNQVLIAEQDQVVALPLEDIDKAHLVPSL